MQIIKENEDSVNAVVSALKKGQVVIVPTDTVYGFLADAKNQKAVEIIYQMKRRDRKKPLPVFIKNLGMARIFAIISKDQESILKQYWPGAYTFILKRNKNQKLFGVDQQTIALRMPNRQFIGHVLKKINRPLVQTSVNIADEPAMNSPVDIEKKFGQHIAIGLLVDGGIIENGKSSTVMDITQSTINVRRQ